MIQAQAEWLRSMDDGRRRTGPARPGEVPALRRRIADPLGAAGTLSRLLRCTPNFRDGSKGDLSAPDRHFRVTPMNGHRQTSLAGPVGANSGPRALRASVENGRHICT
jgi:hypothetical protein